MNPAKYGIFLLIFGFSLLGFSQSLISPYSRYGLGDLASPGLGRSYGMGDLGVAAPSIWNINIINPSLLVRNTFSSFSTGVSGERRNYSAGDISDSDFFGSLRYLALAFPIKKTRWTTAFSVLPYSSVNYNTFSEDSLSGAAVIKQQRGDGGLTDFSWSNGIRIYKSLAIGVKASFIFGSIERLTQIQLFDTLGTIAYPIEFKETISYSDIVFSGGISYQLKLTENTGLSFGALYNFSGKLDGEKDETFQRISGVDRSPLVTVVEGVPVKFDLPESYGVGVSYYIQNKLMAGVDFNWRKWGNSAGAESKDESYINTLNISIGGEYTPDYESITSYMERVTYRLGFASKKLPYLVNNAEINDFGISFGASFPVMTLSSLDMAVKVGQRGTSNNGLIRERYFQFTVGASINDNQWFIKRRYD